MNRLTWFRAYARMVDDDKLRLLAFEDRWHFVALMCCKAQGLLDERGALMRRKVAVKLGLDTRELEEVARRLAEVDLIHPKTLVPLAWDRLQFVSDHDPTRNERQQRFRESKRKGNALHNGRVTRTDTDTDTEKEKDILVPSVPSGTAKGDYSPAFEAVWADYPQRAGGNSKRDAFKAWAARVKAGADPGVIHAGVLRYAAFLTATGKAGTEFVKQAATFFGPAEHYREPWTAPRKPEPVHGGQVGVASAEVW